MIHSSVCAFVACRACTLCFLAPWLTTVPITYILQYKVHISKCLLTHIPFHNYKFVFRNANKLFLHGSQFFWSARYWNNFRNYSNRSFSVVMHAKAIKMTNLSRSLTALLLSQTLLFPTLQTPIQPSQQQPSLHSQAWVVRGVVIIEVITKGQRCLSMQICVCARVCIRKKFI